MSRIRRSVRCVILFGWCALAVPVDAAAQAHPSVFEPGANRLLLESERGGTTSRPTPVAARCGDRLWNGALIGTAVGGALGYAFTRSECGNDTECRAISHRAVTWPGFAGGAAVGAILDALQRSDCGGIRPAASHADQPFSLSTASGLPSLDSGWSMTGTAAFSKVYDDEGSLGAGPSFAGSVGFSWSRSSTLEFTLLHARHVRDVTGFRWESRPTTATVRVIREFGSSRVRPLVAGGVGVMWVSGRTEMREWRGPFNPPPVTVASHEWDSTGLAIDLALGVNVHATDRLFVRPEWRLVASRPDRAPFAPEPPYSMMIWTVGVGYRF